MVRRLVDGPYQSSPEQKAAGRALKKAIGSRRLVPPSACSRCGGTAGRIEGHHHKGYAPEHHLDVQWLCTSCHAFANLAGKQKARRPISQRRTGRKPLRIDVETLLRAVEGGR